jgi:CDP-4-dehydro-6-deoxyglucose reductase
VRITGPSGGFVFDLASRAPVLFVAWADAFAPIKSLIQHAMSLEINETMRLYWVDGDTGHYRDNLCRSWADAYDNFIYTPLVATDDMAGLAARILDAHADLAALDIYAAGPSDFLDALRALALTLGLRPTAWHAEHVA